MTALQAARPADDPGAPATATATRRAEAGALRARLLVLAFSLFNWLRVLSYLPAMHAMWQQGDSSQHSLVTWCTWLGANLTMACWCHEQGGRRMNMAVWINLSNTAMCTAMVVLIVALRL